MKAARFFERSRLVAKRGSAHRSGRSSTCSQNRRYWALLPTVITTGPSPASNTP